MNEMNWWMKGMKKKHGNKPKYKEKQHHKEAFMEIEPYHIQILAKHTHDIA